MAREYNTIAILHRVCFNRVVCYRESLNFGLQISTVVRAKAHPTSLQCIEASINTSMENLSHRALFIGTMTHTT